MCNWGGVIGRGHCGLVVFATGGGVSEFGTDFSLQNQIAQIPIDRICQRCHIYRLTVQAVLIDGIDAAVYKQTNHILVLRSWRCLEFVAATFPLNDDIDTQSCWIWTIMVLFKSVTASGALREWSPR